MNGLEALDTIGRIVVYSSSYNDCSEDIEGNYPEEYKAIEHELKVLQILKEKKVDLDFVKEEAELSKPIDVLMYIYNSNHKDTLTSDEMTLLVEWLKGE